ncbi:phosphate ABC transporter permease subunit PstC [Peptostreptococcus russellii]|uniref:phosphate ABC transporter permease subunit PstC n=1 Tax=Peptostreptococcus russellii TaxID=215200 RepID=UPI00162A136C|nr:phosphate ABC transporter permease subunit PstC [Peptostreptococcus russellii]MBC2578332.1 phosphate ABC transporter permease subunit PstC [Peptostreptococcus russellii]
MRKRVVKSIQKWIIYILAAISVITMLLMAFQIVTESIPAFKNVGLKMFDPSEKWLPVSSKPQFGLVAIILGTIYVSILGVAIALILGLGCAFFLNFYTGEKIASIAYSFIDMVSGIPSVIFGFIGLTVVVKWFTIKFDMVAGQCVLSAAIVLGIILIPFVVSSCSESIKIAREKYELNTLALGFSKESFILKVVLPAIKEGILASAIMAFGRGLGETMAVMMVIGNSPIFPKLLGRAQTLPALTALEMGSIEYGSIHMSVLYAANLILLVLLAIVLGVAYTLNKKISKE